MRPLTTSVTALRFIAVTDRTTAKPFSALFAGVGNQVHIFKLGSAHPSIATNVLPNGERIHGFSDGNENRVIVHGGRFAVVVTANLSSEEPVGELLVGTSTEFKDWVWNSLWINQGRFVALACGHSTVFVGDSTDLRRRFEVQCMERELIWSATLFTSASRSSLRAVAGTSFGNVLVWTILDEISDECISLKFRQLEKCIDSLSEPGERRPAHRLQAHDGPIMKLNVSQDAQRMVSASVDRSVGVWRVSTTAQCAQCSVCASDGCFTKVLSHYGHLARVWDVGFLNSESLVVVSVAEDRTCRVWSETVASSQLAVFHGHAGRNVWSLDVQPIHRESAWVATGGEDGCIKLRNIPIPSGDVKVDMKEDHVTKHWGSQRCLSRFCTLPGNYSNPRKNGGAHNESGRTLLLLTNELLFVSTDFGRILVARIRSLCGLHEYQALDRNKGELCDHEVSWTELYRNSAGTAYAPSSLTICNGLLFGGQTNGCVTILRLSSISGDLPFGEEVGNIPVFLNNREMVMGIFTISTLDGISTSLFAATGSGDLYHWQIEKLADGKITSTYCRTYRQTNPTKSALVTSVFFVLSHSIVVVGDRGGRVLLYDVIGKGSAIEAISRRTKIYELILHPLSICRPHKDRVSSISMASVNRSNGNAREDTVGAFDLLTSGFDGRLARLRLNVTQVEAKANGMCQREMSIDVLSSQKPIEHVDTIARLAFPHIQKQGSVSGEEMKIAGNCVYDRHCIVGFRSADVIIWDVQQRNELFRTNCGNWRRAFDVYLDLNTTTVDYRSSQLTVEQITVVFWRSGKLYIVRTLDDTHDTEVAEYKAAGHHCRSNSRVTSQTNSEKSVHTIGAGFHGQRANAVSWIEGSNVVLTGSEDTTINVTKLRDGYWHTTQTLSRHISGVSSLSTSRVSNMLLTFSGGGSDELVTWLAREAQGPWKDVCAMAIGGKNRERQAKHRVTCVSSVDGRFCRCNFACGTAVAGRSDGSVGLVRSAPATGERYRQAGREWNCTLVQLSNEGHHGAVLCCSSTTAHIAGLDTLVAVTGDSQGALVVWIMALGQACGERRLLPIHRLAAAHDGGVNAVAVRVEEDGMNGTIVLVSGGDDERVRVHMALLKGKGDEGKGGPLEVQECVTEWVSPLGMHSAAVTALCFAEHVKEMGEANLDWAVAVAGADQRVNWLQVVRGEKRAPRTGWEVRHICEASARANVPDVAAIRARTKHEGEKVMCVAVVAGCGLEEVQTSWKMQ